MDYFNDFLATFLDLDRVRIIAVYGSVQRALGMHKKYRNLNLKMNKALTGLERHKGK